MQIGLVGSSTPPCQSPPCQCCQTSMSTAAQLSHPSASTMNVMDDLPDGFRHSRKDETDTCDLCGREQPLTYHHLIPKTNHKNKWFKKRFDKHDMTHRGLWLCRACHKMLHRTFSEKELGRHYNTLDAINQVPAINRFVAWVKKQK